MKLESPDIIRADTELFPLLRRMAQSAERNISLMTMSLDTTGKMRHLIGDLTYASHRGVDVQVTYDDYYSRLDSIKKHGVGGLGNFYQTLEDMQGAGVGVTGLGKARLNPFSGRHHSKVYTADYDTLIAGGVNLTNEGFRQDDYMLHFQDSGLANLVRTEIVASAAKRRDLTAPIDSENTIFVDGGQNGKSIILEKTIEILDGASRAWYVSQMLPTAELAIALREVDDLQAWYNEPSQGGVFNRLSIVLDKRKSHLPNSYKRNSFLHAKFCMAEYPDGSRQAITGSHNFNERGVSWGTHELALCTTSPDTCQKLEDFAAHISGA